MKISNDVFSKIHDFYDSRNTLDSLYDEESACLMIFRILPELCQQTVMRLLNSDGLISYKVKEMGQEWPDLIPQDPETKKCFDILLMCRIVHNSEYLVLNQNFKKNLLKVLNEGISPKTGILSKKKTKDWSECFEEGLKALENYLLKILKLEGPLDEVKQLYEVGDKNVALLVDSKLIEIDLAKNKCQLTSIALHGMLDDRLTQIRLLIIRFINVLAAKYKREPKLYEFFKFLFKISTLEVGAVSK
jgi:hypothetical protein